MIGSLFSNNIPPRWENYRMLTKALKFSNFIVVIIQVSSKKLVKAMLKFVFVLKLRWVKLLLIVVFFQGALSYSAVYGKNFQKYLLFSAFVL